MPDGDVIRRGVRYEWRPAYEELCGNPSQVDVSGVIAKCLSASLRLHGIPPLSEATHLIESVWAGRVSTNDAMKQTSTVTGCVGGTRDTSLLDAAVRHILMTGPTGARADQSIAEAFCKARIEAELMAKLRPAILENEDCEPQDAEAIIRDWMEQSENVVRRIAAQLLSDPTGKELRSPPSRRRKRKTTAELLQEPIA